VTDLAFILLPFLLLAVPAVLLVRAARRPGWTRVEARIVAARLGENDAGSVTQYFPVLSVAYVIGGRDQVALDLPVARESHPDARRVRGLLSDRYGVGAPVDILCNPRSPERASIA